MSNDARQPDQLGERYLAVQSSPEFGDLRRTFRRFVFPVTGFFLVWYLAYVLLSIFAPGLMGTKVVGSITVGLVFGLLQFVTTFAITLIYARWAARTLDPKAQRVAAMMEQAEAATTGAATGGRA